jgi:hypothetical protein
VLAVGGPSKRVILESQEGGLVVVGLQPDVAAFSAVPSVWTPLRHVGFAAETNASRAPVTGFGVQLGAVNEGGHRSILGRGRSPEF